MGSHNLSGACWMHICQEGFMTSRCLYGLLLLKRGLESNQGLLRDSEEPQIGSGWWAPCSVGLRELLQAPGNVGSGSMGPKLDWSGTFTNHLVLLSLRANANEPQKELEWQCLVWQGLLQLVAFHCSRMNNIWWIVIYYSLSFGEWILWILILFNSP